MIERHMDMVFHLCYRMMRDYDEANDCAQETFVKIYRSLDSFRMRSCFTTWIYRIAVNSCKNRIASAQYRASRLSRSLDDGIHFHAGDERSNPETIFEKKESATAVTEAVHALPEDLRVLIILRDFENRSYEEIAEICSLKIGTVKSKIARARQILRDALRGVL